MRYRSEKVVEEAGPGEENTLVFYVNGKKVVEPNPDPELNLLAYIRTELLLTGSKLGCGEGGCGACTVMVSKYLQDKDTVIHYNVNACLFPLCDAHGLAVTTVEGIGDSTNLHPVQERIARFHGTQCGYCTPGMVMSMYTLLRNNSKPSQGEIKHFLDGNLCRCTGYRPILEGFNTFSKEFECGMGEKCCKKVGAKDAPSLTPDVSALKPYDSTQQLIFPPDLKVNHASYWSKPLKIQGARVLWVRPTTLSDLITLKEQYPEAKIVVGNTDLGVQTKNDRSTWKVLISPTNITEMTSLTVDQDGVRVGGAVSLSKLSDELENIIATTPTSKTKILASLVEQLKWFANPKIRNVASMTGSIMGAKATFGLGPILMAARAVIKVVSKERGVRTLIMDESFYQGPGKTAVEDDEIIESISLPFTKEGDYMSSYKQSIRKDNSFPEVSASMMVTLSENGSINQVRLAFGGVAEVPVLARLTMQGLVGLPWTSELMDKVQELLPQDMPVTTERPMETVEYRRAAAFSFFFKFFLQTKQQLPDQEVSPKDTSALTELDSPPPRSTQLYGGTAIRDTTSGDLSKPLPHSTAVQHSTGEAVFVNDMKPLPGELYVGLVISTRAHARLLSIDPSLALQCPGVVDFISAKDVPGENAMVFHDHIFAVDEVTSEGQVIAAVVANTQEQAREGARKVKVEYEDLPAIITIQEAIDANSFYEAEQRNLSLGDIEAGFAASDHVIEGEAHIGGQSHFYMETHASRAVPGENDELEMFIGTQFMCLQQMEVAKALGIPANKVHVRCKRMGGAFGGKSTQPGFCALPAAIAAKRLGRPVRVQLDRDEHMVVAGNRHPFLMKYKVGVTKEGKIQALDAEFYNNAGNSLDFSHMVMSRGMMMQMESTYQLPNFRMVGRMCKTNITSNTAFRSFGAVQCAQLTESMLDDVAAQLNLDPIALRVANFFPPGGKFHFGQDANGESMLKCWKMCEEKSALQERLKAVEAYNRENTWKKRGIAMSPIAYGISYLCTYLSQAGALVHIYHDGTALLSHGGVEFGQGLNIKMLQVASECLGIPVSQIHINETNTSTVASSSLSGGSMSTDLNGCAVKNACEDVMGRLEPYIKQNPDGGMSQWAKAAYMDAVSLTGTGFFALRDTNYDMDKPFDNDSPFCYFTYGTACTEVQIDCLTGAHTVLRTDIVMDIGQSINPAVDIGQIEGGYTQGLGLMLMEHVKVSPQGNHLSIGPNSYSIPSVYSIPAEFNVYLVPDSDRPRNLFTSKGMNEPPVCLAPSAFFAVKNAIRAARADNGASARFQLNCPALPDQIRMACQDDISNKFPKMDPKSYRPAFVQL